MFNLFGLTWNDFCYNDWDSNFCWSFFFLATFVIVWLILIIARVIFRLTGRPWPWWLYFFPEETLRPIRMPVWQAILILVVAVLSILIGAIRQGGMPHNP